MTYAEDLERVMRDGWSLKFIEHQTEEICLAAVMEDGIALQFVKKQTPEICLAAVMENPYTLLHVKEQTPEIIRAICNSFDNCSSSIPPYFRKKIDWSLLIMEDNS